MPAINFEPSIFSVSGVYSSVKPDDRSANA